MTKLQELRESRATWCVGCLLLISLVGDGGSQKAAGLRHQLLVLPVTLLFLVLLHRILANKEPSRPLWSVGRALALCVCFEVASCGLFFYQAHHFAAVGYQLHWIPTLIFYGLALATLFALMLRVEPEALWVFLAGMGIYAGGVLLAIYSFPLTYLRSDMLPVIEWAGTNLLHHINPYATIYVDHRVYHFPYLPGMIVAYLPWVAAHLDLRFAVLAFNLTSAVIVYCATRVQYRGNAAVLLVLFFLSPFLQYRHELYIAPHWLTLVAAFLLLYRRRFLWAAFVLGVSAAMYQFTWLLLPFVLLYAYRRDGWREVAKEFAVSFVGMMLIVGPFLRIAAERIFSDTVTDWGKATHADAMPMNLSYWITYVVPVSRLLQLQIGLMAVLFAVALWKRRCTSLEETMRFSIFALTVFILCNVLVDGYFYLMLLFVLLCYVCVANEWWERDVS